VKSEVGAGSRSRSRGRNAWLACRRLGQAGGSTFLWFGTSPAAAHLLCFMALCCLPTPGTWHDLYLCVVYGSQPRAGPTLAVLQMVVFMMWLLM
jgi:hypothetical protein